MDQPTPTPEPIPSTHTLQSSTFFLCPKCNANQWLADYDAAIVQPVDYLVQLDTGELEATYSQPGEIVEEGPTEQWRCENCGYTIDTQVLPK